MPLPADENPMRSRLSPSQFAAMDSLLRSLPMGDVFTLWCPPGFGRTTILREVHGVLGGAMLTLRQFIDAMHDRHPLAMEESFMKLVWNALASNDVVAIDDLHLLSNVMLGGCGGYPRHGWLDGALSALVTHASDMAKKLIVGTAGRAPEPIDNRSYNWGFDEFTPADYEYLCHAMLVPSKAGVLNYAKIHRFAPNLNAHQLRLACSWLARDANLSTDRFIDYLRSQRITSNVDLAEVQAVDLKDLKGVDDLLQSLEAHVIVPLENDRLATELGIKPRRGVLLAGPPGTGKTTIGRALAHRLKGKFFVIDGTFISGTGGFYRSVHEIFNAAQQNAPSVIFIDDTDVIFENGQEAGLYRYLLTMLDGLESKSAGRVCVMMTAMNVAALPPALLRSGRIELWLETKLPDEAARREILEQHLHGLPEALSSVNLVKLALKTDGMTGADLKRVCEDGKILFAYDAANNREPRTATSYFLKAIKTVRQNKEHYAQAEKTARERKPTNRPPWFSAMDSAEAQFNEDDIPF